MSKLNGPPRGTMRQIKVRDLNLVTVTPLTTPRCRSLSGVPAEQLAEMCLIVESAGAGHFS